MKKPTSIASHEPLAKSNIYFRVNSVVFRSMMSKRESLDKAYRGTDIRWFVSNAIRAIENSVIDYDLMLNFANELYHRSASKSIDAKLFFEIYYDDSFMFNLCSTVRKFYDNLYYAEYIPKRISNPIIRFIRDVLGFSTAFYTGYHIFDHMFYAFIDSLMISPLTFAFYYAMFAKKKNIEYKLFPYNAVPYVIDSNLIFEEDLNESRKISGMYNMITYKFDDREYAHVIFASIKNVKSKHQYVLQAFNANLRSEYTLLISKIESVAKLYPKMFSSIVEFERRSSKKLPDYFQCYRMCDFHVKNPAENSYVVRNIHCNNIICFDNFFRIKKIWFLPGFLNKKMRRIIESQSFYHALKCAFEEGKLNKAQEVRF